MKIILVTKVINLGNVGDIVNARDGYAKNFLIPQKKAIFYSIANYKIFEERKQHIQDEFNKKSLEAKEIKQKLEGKNILIISSASDDGRLYGSINSGIIANKVNELINSKIITRSNIIIKKPIKEIGIHHIKVDLHSGIAGDIQVIVGRTEAEIENLIAKQSSQEQKEATKIDSTQSAA